MRLFIYLLKSDAPKFLPLGYGEPWSKQVPMVEWLLVHPATGSWEHVTSRGGGGVTVVFEIRGKTKRETTALGVEFTQGCKDQWFIWARG